MNTVQKEFDVLEDASTKQLEVRMKKDEEQSPDLAAQLKSIFDDRDNGRCKMFREDGVLKRSQYIPLPEDFRRELNRLDGGARRYQIIDAGLLPEINRVWVIGDNKLWLWNYLKQDVPYEWEECPGFGADRLLAVSLCVPRPGVFVDEINYLLVVATDVEVVLVALQFDPVRSAIFPIRTDFRMSLDNVVCKKIACSQYGRIFLAGHDGSLCELEYDNVEGGVSALLGLGGLSDKNRTRCRKRKHNCWDWRLTRVLPSFFSGLDERMEDICIDNVRNMLYTVSFSKWWSAPPSFRSGASLTMQMLFLGESGRKTYLDDFVGQYVAALPVNIYVPPFDLFAECRKFCAASKNGVLRQMTGKTDESKEPFSDSMLGKLGDNGQRVVVGMHVVPLTESSKVHLVVVLSHGFRVYLRIAAPRPNDKAGEEKAYLEPFREAGGLDRPITADSDAKLASRSSISATAAQGCRAIRLEVAYIRAPPKRMDPSDATAEPMFCSDFNRGGTQDITMQRSYYSQGILLTSVKQQGGGGGGGGGGAAGEALLALTTDLKNHNNKVGDMPAWANPTLRESLCVLPFAQRDAVSEVRDIAESAQAMHFSPGCMPMQMLSLFSTSYTPRDSPSAYRAPQPHLPPGAEAQSETPLHPMPLLAPSDRPLGTGVQRNALGQIVTLNECVLQHVPAAQHSLQRQLLVLESSSPVGSPVLSTFGITVLRKRRPVDQIYEALCRNQPDVVIVADLTKFYTLYGSLEFCAMCIGIACGLPGDSGDSGVLSMDMQQVPPPIHDDIRFKAMKAMFTIMDQNRVAIATGGGSGASAETLLLAKKVAEGQALNEKEREVYIASMLDMDLRNFPVVAGLQAVASRILRPLWFRVVAVDYHSKELKAFLEHGGQFNKRLLAAFWSVELISSVQRPLRLLLDVISKMYPKAVSSDPTAAVNAAGGAGEAKLPAYHEEHVAVSKLHRLLSRSAQALSLLRLLLVAERDWKWGDWSLSAGPGRPEVPWQQWCWGKACFQGVTFRKLVVDREAHERTSQFLTELVAVMAKKREAADKVQHLTAALEEECYMYYGIGDQMTNAAQAELLRLKEMINQSLSRGSQQTKDQAAKVVRLMNSAARYWRTHARVDNDLAKFCLELAAHGDEMSRDGLVDICLTAAENFSSALFSNPSTGVGAMINLNLSTRADGSINWDRGLYHSSEETSEAGRNACLLKCYETLLDQIIAARRQAPRAGAVGARQGSGGDEAATRMIQRAIHRAGAEPHFQATLCRKLLFAGMEKHLLELRERFVDDYLRANEHMEMLYRWHKLHELHERAGHIMYEQAIAEPNPARPRRYINDRIHDLSQALASADDVCRSLSQAGAVYVNAKALETRANYAECLVLAEIQRECGAVLTAVNQVPQFYTQLQQQQPKFDELQTMIADLDESFVPKSKWADTYWTLLLETVAPLCVDYVGTQAPRLFAVMLKVLKVFRSQAANDYLAFWRKVIYSIVPGNAECDPIRDWIVRKRTASLRDAGPELGDISRRTQLSFERDADHWIKDLISTVQDLGASLDDSLGGDSLSPAFPKGAILEELEAIFARVWYAQQQENACNAWKHGLAPACLLQMRVPYLTLVNCYVDIVQRGGGGQSEGRLVERLQLLDSAVWVLRQWVSAALVYSPAHEDDARKLVPLVRVPRQGQSTMSRWLASLRNEIGGLKPQVRASPARGRDQLSDWLLKLERGEEELVELVARLSISIQN